MTTRLAQVKVERDAALADVSRWQCAAAWQLTAGGILAECAWSDDSDGRYSARLVVGPRTSRALVVMVFRHDDSVPIVTLHDFDSWDAAIACRGGGSDATYREGECRAAGVFRVALHARMREEVTS